MILNDLLTSITPLRVIGDTNKDITAIQFDSRKVEAGNLFVAQAGTAVDGHQFIASCVEKGAAAIVLSNDAYLPQEAGTTTYILVENTDRALGLLAGAWYGNPSRQLTLVGVTGTNGKTTIATLLYKLVRAMGYKAGLL